MAASAHTASTDARLMMMVTVRYRSDFTQFNLSNSIPATNSGIIYLINDEVSGGLAGMFGRGAYFSTYLFQRPHVCFHCSGSGRKC